MKRVLFVDDDPVDTLVLRRIVGDLNRSSVEVETAESLASAHQILRERGPFDLVVTDQMMRVGSGDQLLLLIRAGQVENGLTGTRRDVPVILVSGAADERGGFDAAFPKPYDIYKLLDAFERVLGIPLSHDW